MPNNAVTAYARKTGKSAEEVEKVWNQAKSKIDKPENSKEYYPEVMTVFKKMLGLNEDVAASTTTSDVAINPVPQGKLQTRLIPKAEWEPDGQLSGLDYFDVDYHNFSTAAQAKVLRQRYNFNDKRVIAYLKKTNWTKPFYLKHREHIVKVGKI